MVNSTPHTPIRWLHLSDFHVGKDEYAQDTLFNEILNNVNLAIAENRGPDLVFITGDIAQRGLKEEYETFSKNFLLPLYKLLGREARRKTFIIPGNHDVERDIYKYFDRGQMCSLDSHLFDPTLEGIREREQLLPRFTQYSECKDIVPQGGWLSRIPGSFVQPININGVILGIVGINTAWLSKDKNDRHTLTPGINILEKSLASDSIKNCNLKIVLGHHPIDWMHDDHIEPIKAILGKNSALYLHGHLHKNRVSTGDGAGYGYLTVQSGAAFQTRGDYWINGLLWTELDLTNGFIKLQPNRWSLEQKGWQLSTELPESKRQNDWWYYALPNNHQVHVSTPIRAATYPEGWQEIDEDFLKLKREELTLDSALPFFDGANPDWKVVLSPIIPRLTATNHLIKAVGRNYKLDKLSITLLKGPLGEGKSTALMQTVENIITCEEKCRVLWRTVLGSALRSEDLMNLPKADRPWLIVSDAVDDIIDQIFDATVFLDGKRDDIHFLLACRSTDWTASGAHKFKWIEHAHFQLIEMSGLNNPDDATAIIESWRYFGEEALGDSVYLKKEDAAKQLLKIAENDQVNQSSLLGALLKIRYGEQFNERIKTLLFTFEDRMIPGTGLDLLEAFFYIAAMHLEDFTFLTRPILAEAMGCQLKYVDSYILAPLSREAVVSNHGRAILTRHQGIAEVVTKLVTSVFEQDLEEKYIELTKAVIRLKDSSIPVPALQRWNPEMPLAFMKKEKIELSSKIADQWLLSNPNNLGLIINRSRIYRESGQFAKVILLMESNIPLVLSRKSFDEWSVAENFTGNEAFGAILCMCTLHDDSHPQPITRSKAAYKLSGLHFSFSKLSDKYMDDVYRNAGMATMELMSLLEVKKITKKPNYFHTKKIVNIIDLLEDIKKGVIKSWDVCSDAKRHHIQTFITNPAEFKLQGLTNLLQNALKTVPSNLRIRDIILSGVRKLLNLSKQ